MSGLWWCVVGSLLAGAWGMGLGGVTECVERCQREYAESVGMGTGESELLSLRTSADLSTFCRGTEEARDCVGDCARGLPESIRRLFVSAFKGGELLCEELRSETESALPCLQASSETVSSECEDRCGLVATYRSVMPDLQSPSSPAQFSRLASQTCEAIGCFLDCSEEVMGREPVCRRSPAPSLLRRFTRISFAHIKNNPTFRSFLPRQCIDL